MRVTKISLLLTLCFLHPASYAQQSTTNDFAQGPDFVIDPSKPYVYLEVDHVGPRKPVRNGEPEVGIWLRLKNNCRVRIVVMAVGKLSQNPKDAITLEDEILPNLQNPMTRGDGTDGAVYAPDGLEEMKDVFRWPDLTEDEVRGSEAAQRSSRKSLERPRGYGSRNGFDTFTIRAIPPGGQALFSVPANHVSQSWHFEIPFRLALPNKSKIRPPYSYVAFYEEDLKDAQADAATPTTH